MTVNLPAPNSPTTTTTVPASTAGTGGSFPQTPSEPVTQQSVLSMSPAQFFQDFHITTSTEQKLYVTNGKLNISAYDLAWYVSLPQQEKQTIQQELVNTGQLAASDANGLNNSTALSAWKGLIGLAQQQGTDAKTWISNQVAASSGTNAIQNTISSQITAATKNLSAPLTITQTNPTTLAAQLTNAFDQALGYAPDQKQIQSFIDQIQGQETTYGSAPRAEAQAQITQAHAQESALNQLGANGLDSVISAYQAAVTGTKLPGAGTVQGPVNGSVPNPATPIPPGTPTAGSALPAGDAFRYQGGNLVGADVLPTTNTTITHPATSIHVGQPAGLFGGGFNMSTGGTIHIPAETKTTTSFVHNTMPYAPANVTGSTNTHGGMFALSPQDWVEAKKLIPGLIKPSMTTPGLAPLAVQHAAISALLQNAYETNGNSWSKAISSIASGSPFGTAEGTHLSAFGDQVAAEVNNQIKALQSQVNNDAITTKVTTPDAAAEAAAAAKQSDPVGYYAANSASWGNELNQMLTGAPLMYGQSTSDTFSGPVPTSVAGTASSSGVAPSVASTGVK